MTTDARRSLIEYLWTRLTTDATLQSAMGGEVRCYLAEAETDAEFPYLVHRVEIGVVPGTYVVQRATYFLDVWSDSPNAEQITAIRARIVTLLDELVFDTDDVKRVHIEFFSDSDMPEPKVGIWHYTTMWELVFIRKTEATNINGR